MDSRTAGIPNGGAAFTPEELSDILEYEKIVQFRDSILAGTHPRVKIHANPKIKSIIPNLSSNSHPKTQSRPYSSNVTEIKPHLNEEQRIQSTPPSTNIFSASRSAMSKNSEINPILLEKSDDLIKAEIQLQRQRLERGLREQVEHQRLAAKALLQTSELLPDFDISEALCIALAIVPPAGTARNESPAAPRSPGSNSFDDNTFYSSQCNSPTPSASLEIQRIACDQIPAPAHSEWSSTEHLKNIEHLENRLNPSLQTSFNAKQLQLEPKTNHYGAMYNENFRERERPITARLDSRDAGCINLRTESNPLEHTTGRTSELHQKYIRQGLHNDHIPTQIRNHDLPLVAPQPERVSPRPRPKPTASDSLIQGAINGRQQAQVTALRHLPPFPSADSSPRVKSREKKREKKKRKVKNTNTPNSPHIKSEPKSPSFSIPIPPPQKRQRSQYDSELNFERLRPRSNIQPQEHTLETSRWPHRSQEQSLPYEPAGYESHYRHNEGINTSQRISSALPIHRPQSPQYSISHQPTSARPRAVSNFVGGKYIDDRDYAIEPMPRASLRPNMDRERTRSPPYHNTQTGPLRQYLVDEHSRQYLSSTPMPAIGHSVTSTARYREEDICHEKIPMRTVSARMPLENYENDDYLRRRNSPVYTKYRRVITQPEYLTSPLPNQRPPRQRAYSVYPTTAASPYGEDKDPYRVAPDYRQMSHYEEPPREYLRATTMRPELSKYEPPREYLTQIQHARPEPHLRGQELRREMLPHGSRELNSPAVESVSQWKDYLPMEKYHDIAPKVISHAEHNLSHEESNYYNDPSSRRPYNSVDQNRLGETSRYADRY